MCLLCSGSDPGAGTKAQLHAVGGKPGWSQSAQQEGPNIALLSPALQKQWDHAANGHMGNIIIKAQSHRKVAWKCDACPDGHLHQWTASVASRTNGTGCPQCRSRKVCKHNCLATKAPWAAAQWDYEANAALGTPDTVVANSSQPAGWHCQVYGHKWTVTPHSRVSKQSGCPHCAYRGAVTRHPTFAECQHSLLTEWDHARNEPCGNYLDNTRLKSSKHIFWLCSNCPAGQEHSWSAPPRSRTDRLQHGCPVCAGKVACKCNSLQELFPATAAEWDYGKNQGRPSEYTAFSAYLAWWYTPQRGSWQQRINARTGYATTKLARQKHVQD